MDLIVTLIQAAVAFGTVIMFGCVGEILTEKSGSLNLGVPGIMYIGGISGVLWRGGSERRNTRFSTSS